MGFRHPQARPARQRPTQRSNALTINPGRVTLCDVAGVDDLDWIPNAGCHLSHGDLIQIFTALRALVNGTEPDEPNRAHAVTVAYVVAEAIERAGGGS
jgi:hypothetical protein